jgi:hypothetical protein
MVTSVVEPPYLRRTPAAGVLCKVHRYLPAETLILLVSRHSASTEMRRDRRFDLLQGNRPFALILSIGHCCLLTRGRQPPGQPTARYRLCPLQPDIPATLREPDPATNLRAFLRTLARAVASARFVGDRRATSFRILSR